MENEPMTHPSPTQQQIVRAVNSHEQLVEALEALVHLAKSGWIPPDSISEEFVDGWNGCNLAWLDSKALAQAEAALAAAKGGQQ